jgi:CPA1 family monovalent cation:H+ antiporter
MQILEVSAVLVTLAAVFSFLNERFIKLPSAIGLMLIALLMSLALIGLGSLGFDTVTTLAADFVSQIDFNVTLMHGMLSFLLFAGALHVNLSDLAEQKWVIATLATFGTLLSTLVVGGLFWLLCPFLGFEIDFIYCLLFGALISPTDPIAVLGILKSAGAPKTLETKITGESLFNDGIGVVVFVVLLEVATSGHGFSPGRAVELLLEEAVGGVIFGLAIGGIGYWMLARVDAYTVEVLVTLAVVLGGYTLALAIHTSGPIAVVVAGLILGNHGRRNAMSEKTREHLDTFWELIDEMLNTLLFVLIGLEILVLSYTISVFVASIIAIPLVLFARSLGVGLPVWLLSFTRAFTPGAYQIMVWGGLRGGISIALALSIPSGAERDLILPVTYAVVVFSILVQGLTVGPLISRIARRDDKN